jgi:biotin synthase
MRHDWTLEEVRELFATPLLDLVFRAACIHRAHHEPSEVQVCKLISIKTGACPEDCSYCSQSSRYQTEVQPSPLMEREEVMQIARRAQDAGVTRVCLGAAWREVRDGRQFDRVLDIVKDVASLGLEVCCTLGMLNEQQAARLEEAGLYAYNHNLDTSEQFYSTIITTRKYADRLATLANVRKTNVTLCTGGIIGLGESESDRISLLHTLATLRPHPESVPINVLAKVPGTPLESQPDVPIEQTVRMIAAARVLMPSSVVRLSAGRAAMSGSDQALCFLAGANSIFSSDDRRMLTRAVESPDYDADRSLLKSLGLKPRPPRSAAAGGRDKNETANAAVAETPGA